MRREQLNERVIVWARSRPAGICPEALRSGTCGEPARFTPHGRYCLACYQGADLDETTRAEYEEILALYANGFGKESGLAEIQRPWSETAGLTIQSEFGRAFKRGMRKAGIPTNIYWRPGKRPRRSRSADRV